MATTKSGVLINEYKPVSRGDYGIRVARNGFDANTAGDSNLLFNSNWPIIQIVKVISEENKVKIIDETEDIPASWILVNEQKSGIFIWDCAVDEKWLYLPKYTYMYRDPDTYEIHWCDKQYKIYHGLGYVPIFFHSEYVSDKPGYYLMTNIDMRKDADYPYTSKASYYDGATKNYGIRSKSHTRKSMPQPGETRGCGVSTLIQSKLIMAIKTEKSKTSSDDPQNPAPNAAWGVPKDNNDLKTTKLTDYEPFAYFSRDGIVPFEERPAGNFPQTDPDGCYRIISQDGSAVLAGSHASLVVVRSPMVAPDVEEITIS